MSTSSLRAKKFYLCIALIWHVCHGASASRFSSQQSRLVQPSNVGTRQSDNYSPAATADLVESLPGWTEPFNFNLFAGYVTVDESAGRALFYTFAESSNDPTEDPVMVWLNGGPGCSSIGGGFMSELGPFYPNPDGKSLQRNEHSWNKFASMLFIESPAFVGFSYSNTSEDARTGDQRTTDDLVSFLHGWFKRYPQYKANAFWVAGESYAGHYVPNLAKGILEANKKAPRGTAINLKGFLAGNAWTDAAIDNEGTLDFWWAHAIISDETRDGVRQYCNFSDVGPLRVLHAQHGSRVVAAPDAVAMPGVTGVDPERCEEFVNMAATEMGNINIYEIYADVCASSRAKMEGRQLARMLRDHPAGLSSRPMLRDAPPGYDACVDSEVEAYLNLPEVQEALHANVSGRLPWRWTDCSSIVQYSRDDLLASMLPTYRHLIDAGLQILVFSGDVDGIVPVVGSRRWVSMLAGERRWENVTPWGPWTSSTGQVGGWTVRWDNFAFATVRNAGHMVPYVQPERAFHLVSHFVKRTPSTAQQAASSSSS